MPLYTLGMALADMTWEAKRREGCFPRTFIVPKEDGTEPHHDHQHGLGNSSRSRSHRAKRRAALGHAYNGNAATAHDVVAAGPGCRL